MSDRVAKTALTECGVYPAEVPAPAGGRVAPGDLRTPRVDRRAGLNEAAGELRPLRESPHGAQFAPTRSVGGPARASTRSSVACDLPHWTTGRLAHQSRRRVVEAVKDARPVRAGSGLATGGKGGAGQRNVPDRRATPHSAWPSRSPGAASGACVDLDHREPMRLAEGAVKRAPVPAPTSPPVATAPARRGGRRPRL
jgi:hypothetical protein